MPATSVRRLEVSLGLALLAAAIAGLVILPGQKPGWSASASCAYVACRTGLSPWLYDALRVLTWVFLGAGVLLVAATMLGLGRFSRRGAGTRRPRSAMRTAGSARTGEAAPDPPARTEPRTP